MLDTFRKEPVATSIGLLIITSAFFLFGWFKYMNVQEVKELDAAKAAVSKSQQELISWANELVKDVGNNRNAVQKRDAAPQWVRELVPGLTFNGMSFDTTGGNQLWLRYDHGIHVLISPQSKYSPGHVEVFRAYRQ